MTFGVNVCGEGERLGNQKSFVIFYLSPWPHTSTAALYDPGFGRERTRSLGLGARDEGGRTPAQAPGLPAALWSTRTAAAAPRPFVRFLPTANALQQLFRRGEFSPACRLLLH